MKQNRIMKVTFCIRFLSRCKSAEICISCPLQLQPTNRACRSGGFQRTEVQIYYDSSLVFQMFNLALLPPFWQTHVGGSFFMSVENQVVQINCCKVCRNRYKHIFLIGRNYKISYQKKLELRFR